jgi:ParB-like chromosome segregation protein Spo0J
MMQHIEILHIDPEFQALIHPLSPDELTHLEANIQAEGCRDPLVLWNGTIIDGHHRYSICTQHNVPFTTVEREFASRDEAKQWIIRNQFGRRNLSDYSRGELALQLEELLAAQAKARQGTRTDLHPNIVQNSGHSPVW